MITVPGKLHKANMSCIMPHLLLKFNEKFWTEESDIGWNVFWYAYSSVN